MRHAHVAETRSKRETISGTILEERLDQVGKIRRGDKDETLENTEDLARSMNTSARVLEGKHLETFYRCISYRCIRPLDRFTINSLVYITRMTVAF